MHVLGVFMKLRTVLIVISPFLLLTTRMCSTGAFKIHTDTHTFNGPFSGTTRVGRYQKGKTNLDYTEARDTEWQWHQLGHMQVCTLLQTDNHTRTPPLCSFTCRMPNQQRQSTEGKCGFHNSTNSNIIILTITTTMLPVLHRDQSLSPWPESLWKFTHFTGWMQTVAGGHQPPGQPIDQSSEN